MELQITGQNIDLSPKVKRYAERKLGKLNRHLPSITAFKVEIVEEKTKSPDDRYVIEVTIDASGTILRAEERGADLFTAIDKAAAVMDHRIEHYKGKLYDKGRGTSLARGVTGGEAEEPVSVPRVVKVKRFAVQPMSVDKAIEQMELLEHDFFLFLNAETSELNLVYRRGDGNYGIIEPELG